MTQSKILISVLISSYFLCLVECQTTFNETEALKHFNSDIQQAIIQNSAQNASSDATNLIFTDKNMKDLSDGLSHQVRFLRTRILSVIQNLNKTIVTAKETSEEFRGRLASAAEEFTAKINENTQLLRAGVEQAVAEAISKLQSKAVGIYECTQQQVGIADLWITSSISDLGKCSVPLASAASSAVANVTHIIDTSSAELQNILANLNSCTEGGESGQIVKCLSDLLQEAYGATFKLSSKMAFLLLRANRLIISLPANLAVCGGALLANLNSGITQAIVSVSECAVGILI